MKVKYLLNVIVVALICTGCANRLYKKGLKNYENMEYSRAIYHLENYMAKHDNPDAELKLADSYRLVNDMANAEKWYSKVVNANYGKPIDVFRYARVLMQMEKYDEAKDRFKQYLKTVPDDFVAEMLLASCNTISSFKKDTTLFSLKELDIPEVSSAFAATPYKNGIMFTADKMAFRNSDRYHWTGRSYLGLYFSRKDENGKWLSPMLLKGDVNGAYHEGPACFNNEGNIVYFTRSNADGKKLNASLKNENNLKIYRAELEDDKWTKLTELPFNSNEYSTGHPCLSPDNTTMYFISDMPGGMGGTDIYKTTLKGSDWSKPENLGSTINTAGNEMFPFMHTDGTFYFSSDAHNNLGGLDVFMSFYDGKKWLQVENLNYPLNSSKDDYAFVLKKNNNEGYVSSNRSNEDKIYEVTKNEPTLLLTGQVRHKGTQKGIDSSVVEVLNITNNTRETVMSDKKGMYKIRIKPGNRYVVKASRAMYFPVSPSHSISTIGKKISENMTANFDLEQIVIEKPIVLENIYYDLDKWNIRPDAGKELDKLVQVLIDNPKISIELSSHTDSRAGDQYNLILSDKRAKAAVEYMISKGIDEKRLKWKGYGETTLLNKCKNNVPCSEEEHQQNRRTEFKAIKVIAPISKL